MAKEIYIKVFDLVDEVESERFEKLSDHFVEFVDISYSILATGATTTLNVESKRIKNTTLTLTENSALVLTNTIDGASGVIEVTPGAFTLSMPTGAYIRDVDKSGANFAFTGVVNELMWWVKGSTIKFAIGDDYKIIP